MQTNFQAEVKMKIIHITFPSAFLKTEKEKAFRKKKENDIGIYLFFYNYLFPPLK